MVLTVFIIHIVHPLMIAVFGFANDLHRFRVLSLNIQDKNKNRYSFKTQSQENPKDIAFFLKMH